MGAFTSEVQKLYIAYFNRPADPGGLAYWEGQMAAGASQTQVANSFSASAEYQAIYAGKNNLELIGALYQNLFGRTADAGGLLFWAGEMAKGTVTITTVASALASGTTAGSADNIAITNKIAAATTFTTAIDTAEEIIAYSKAAAFAKAGTWLSPVKDATTLAAAATTLTATVADAVAAGSASTGQTFTLTAGVNTLTGTTGNDTFDARATLDSWTALDAIDGGLGNDVLNVATTATAAPVGATVTGVETIALSTTGAGYTIDTSVAGTFTGLTSLSVVDSTAGAVGITAAATTDITTGAIGALTIDGGKAVAASTTTGAVAIGGTTGPAGAITLAHTAQAASTISVLGGTSATVTTAQAVAGGAAGGTITVGSAAKAPTGAVIVTSTLASSNVTDGATSTAGAISVTGGSTVTVTQNIAATAAAALTILTGSVAANATGGAIGITGGATTTSATVNQTAAVTAVSSATAGVAGVIDGAVTIADKNAASATLAGTISTVSLTNFGNSTVDSSALTSVTLGGTGGTFGIGRGALTATPTANTLALNVATLTGTNTITDNEAATDDGFTTINLANSGTSVIADLVAADLATLNISGNGSLTLTANTLGGATTTAITSTSTGSVTLGGTLAAGTLYTGGVGVDTITLGASTKAITTGEGNDVVGITAALGTGGTVDGGAGTNTLKLTGTLAATLDDTITFATAVSNFSRLQLTDGATVNLTNLDSINYVTLSGGGTASLSGAATGATLVVSAAATSSTVALAADSSADTLNVVLTNAASTDYGTVVATTFETVALTATESGTLSTDATVIDTATVILDDATAKTITVDGNANVALTFAGTALTTLNASGMTRGGITLTTGALAGAAALTGGAGANTLDAKAAVAAVTLTGGAGVDTLLGSVTIASTLNGGGGNDILTGGVAADVITGGDGIDTFVFTSDATQDDVAGASAVNGVLINLSSSAVTTAAVFTATAKYLTGVAASVASNAATYMFNGESNTNASVVDTLSGIENATGTDLSDYIIGSDGTNNLVGGDEADLIDGGAGNDYLDSSVGNDIDTIIGGAGDDTFVLSDAGEADVWVEAASGGTDTIYVGSDLSFAGYAVGTTIALAAANASLAQFEQVALAAGVDVTFNSAQVTGLALKFAETAAGTSSVVVTASVATSAIDLSGFIFNPGVYTASNGTTTVLSAMTTGTDLIYINGGTGINAITGTTYADVITSGTGVDTLNITNGGTDTIVTTVGVAYASNAADVITGFTVGAAGDVLQIDISDSTAIGVGKELRAGGDIDTAIAGNLVIKAIAKDAATTLAAGDEALVITGTLADAAALVASIGTTGVITKNDTEAASIVVIWNDGTNTYVSAVHDAGTDATMTAADLTVVNMVTFVGVLTAWNTANLVAVS
ncbi:MAG: DUF4214 domain-containing protein [Polaromonas sp.]|nr:DUF4214 domain-containing protein [Polaromonas sp.]